MKILHADWYDYPQYFDLAFRDETALEKRFLMQAFARYVSFPVRRVLEPACGTGRLVAALAAAKYDMVGFDLSESMLAYARKRMERRKLGGELFAGDMANFTLQKPVDAAYNTFNSFRHLLSEAAALAHLNCMAAAVKPGGVYVLGLHLLPPDGSEECLERWSARSGTTRLSGTLRVIESSRRLRRETIRVSLRVRTPSREVRIRSEFPLRLYNACQLSSLIRKAEAWEHVSTFDFWYEIDQPLKLSNELNDTVLVLRRKK